MPKQKSNALVVYSGAGAPCESPSNRDMMVSKEVREMIAKQIEKLKKQMVNASPQKSVGSGIPPYARMMADPLRAPLASRPDYTSSPTNIYRLVDIYDVTSTGTFMNLFTAGLNGSAYVAPTYTGTVVSSYGATSNSQYYTSINTDNSLLRTLVFVVQYMPTANDNVAQGTIHMGFYEGINATSGITLGDITTYLDDNNGVMGPADEPVCIIVRPIVPPFLGNPNATLAGSFPTVGVAGSGLPSTNAGKLIVTRIVEVEPYTGNIPSMVAKRSPCDPLAVACGDNVMGPAATYAAGPGCYDKVSKAGLQMATASARDFENYDGSNPMSRVRKYLSA